MSAAKWRQAITIAMLACLAAAPAAARKKVSSQIEIIDGHRYHVIKYDDGTYRTTALLPIWRGGDFVDLHDRLRKALAMASDGCDNSAPDEIYDGPECDHDGKIELPASHPLSALGEYIEWIAKDGLHSAVYRGHANSNWRLVPSIFREDAYGIGDAEALTRWKQAAARFAKPEPSNDIQWLVLAQHYGIKTPLLDWTTNPLVALFFATFPMNSGSPFYDAGCVVRATRFAFETGTSAPRFDDPFDQHRPIPGLIETSLMNNRSLAQDSIMSIHTASMGALSTSDAELDFFPVREILKRSIREALVKFGMTEDRMYSDMTSAARLFNARLEMERNAESDRQVKLFEDEPPVTGVDWPA